MVTILNVRYNGSTYVGPTLTRSTAGALAYLINAELRCSTLIVEVAPSRIVCETYPNGWGSRAYDRVTFTGDKICMAPLAQAVEDYLASYPNRMLEELQPV